MRPVNLDPWLESSCKKLSSSLTPPSPSRTHPIIKQARPFPGFQGGGDHHRTHHQCPAPMMSWPGIAPQLCPPSVPPNHQPSDPPSPDTCTPNRIPEKHHMVPLVDCCHRDIQHLLTVPLHGTMMVSVLLLFHYLENPKPNLGLLPSLVSAGG